MWLDVAGWILTVIMLILNIWLFISIFRSREASKIYLFLLMYFLIVHDCLYCLVSIYHDIPSYFQNDSILKNLPVLYDISVVFLAVQWFFHLFFLPVFSLLHFTALFFPMYFHRFNMRSTLFVIFCLYAATAGVTIPLFTSCCGFVYNVNGRYWFFDYAKPYTYIYQAVNNWLQGICVAVMVLADVAIVMKLYKIRKTHVISRTSIVAVSSGYRLEADGVTGTAGGSQTRRASRILGPEVRLAISFIMLSGCWLASTLAFNLLMGSTNTFLQMVYLVATYLNRAKWIVYCLGNRNIRKVFYHPGKLFQ